MGRVQTTPSRPPLEFALLQQGAQTAESVGVLLADFLRPAQRGVDVAIYDFLLGESALAPIRAAVDELKARGVRVRIVYDQQPPDRRRDVPVPVPNAVDHDMLRSLGVETRAIPGYPDLMHHKYVIRDADAVWTGSTNWTADSWTLQENLIVRIASAEIAADYARDFEELWRTERVPRSGFFTPAWTELRPGLQARPLFSPGRGHRLSHDIAHAIGRAQRRIRIASPVITSGAILGALADIVREGSVDVAGIYDASQMEEVNHQWHARQSWKPAAFSAVVAGGRFAAKKTTPWRQGVVTPHDFMHAKITVADDTVFVGSFNLSHAGEMNAENVVEIVDPATAELCAGFVDRLLARYGQNAR